jgi:hypothetical protein
MSVGVLLSSPLMQFRSISVIFEYLKLDYGFE